jgi:hypothetical protein
MIGHQSILLEKKIGPKTTRIVVYESSIISNNDESFLWVFSIP